MSFIIDNDAVPEIGLNSAMGIISSGKLNFDNTGSKKENAVFKKLLSKKMFTAKTMASIEGKILKQVIKPSFAPFKKES